MLVCLNRSVMYLDSARVCEREPLEGVRGGRLGVCWVWGWGGLGMNCCGGYDGWCLILSGIQLSLGGRC